MHATEALTQNIYKRVLKLMGNRFELSVVCENEDIANHNIDLAIDEIKRIEALFTTFNENSQTNQINKCAGIHPVKADAEVRELIERCIRISEITQGAFDITYGSIDKSLWNFDQSMTSLPDAETAKKMVRLINYRNIVVNKEENTIFLKNEGMRIGFGGIGKGYAAEKAKEILKKNGVQAGVVNAAGDLTTWGYQPNGKPWTIGIADPEKSDHPFSALNITNMAIATSGNYEKFAIINGKKYSHTIDPKTGLPVSGIKSVSIINPNAELADALATPVTVMGIKAGLNLINQLPLVNCIIIDDNNKLYTSDNVKLT
jgi:FAD:protein FMN transferase